MFSSPIFSFILYFIMKKKSTILEAAGCELAKQKCSPSSLTCVLLLDCRRRRHDASGERTQFFGNPAPIPHDRMLHLHSPLIDVEM